MFTNISKAGLGMYVLLLVNLLAAIGINFDANELTEAIYLILNGIGAFLWLLGQMLRKDLYWGIFRKNEGSE